MSQDSAEDGKSIVIKFLKSISLKDAPLNITQFAKENIIDIQTLQSVKVFLDFFNILTEDEQGIYLQSESAAYFLKSLIIYISNDAYIFPRWDKVTVDVDNYYSNLKNSGAYFLYLIEDRRVNILNIKDHIKSVNIALSIIKGRIKGLETPFYLFQYSLTSRCFQLMGGYFEEKETPQEGLIRRLSAEIEFTELDNVELNLMPEVYTRESISRRDSVYSKYFTRFFEVKFKGSIKFSSLDRWISIEEIRKGKTDDGIDIIQMPKDKNSDYGYFESAKLSFENEQEDLRTFTHIFEKDKEELNFTKLLDKYLDQEESQEIEFKSSIRWDFKTNQVNKDLEKVIIKTIGAFMNSLGGVLMIGVSDDHEVLGLDKDISTLNKKNTDGFIQYIVNLIASYLGTEFTSFISIMIEKPENKEICIIKVSPSPKPIFLKSNDNRDFFVRIANTSRLLNSEEVYKYIQMHW